MTEGYAAMRKGAALVGPRPWGSVLVRGSDSRDFLQSLVSQDLTPLGAGSGARSLLLQPSGKLGIEFRILAVQDEGTEAADHGECEWWLDCEAGYGEALASALERFLVRVDVEILDRSGGFGVVSVRGPDSDRVLEHADAPLPAAAHAHAPWGGARVVRADWPGLRGFDVVGDADVLAARAEDLRGSGAAAATPDDLEIVRVEVGVPRLGAELDESVIPQEALLDSSAVSFEKGCFLGQELVCRIHDRGHVNRVLRRLAVAGEVPPVGADLVAGDRAVGVLTSVVRSPEDGGVHALGFVRREVDPGSELSARWSGGEAGVVVLEAPRGA